MEFIQLYFPFSKSIVWEKVDIKLDQNSEGKIGAMQVLRAGDFDGAN